MTDYCSGNSRQIRAAIALLAGFLLCLLFVGCSALSARPPKVSLKDVRLTEITLFETSLEAVVRLENQDNRNLKIQGGRYELTLNDIEIGSGVSDQAITLPAFGEQEQRIRFYINNIRILTRLQRLLESDEFRYEIEGELATGTFSSLDIEDSGTLYRPTTTGHTSNAPLR